MISILGIILLLYCGCLASSQSFFSYFNLSSEFLIENSHLASFSNAQSACLKLSGHLLWNKKKLAYKLIAERISKLTGI